MCGRITILTYDEIEEVVDAVERRQVMRIDSSKENRSFARPGSVVRAITANDNGLGINEFTWGFTMPESSKLIFNTRIESALGGARMWAGAIRDGRCVLPAASFFEPHGTQTIKSRRTGARTKRQYEFEMPDGSPLLLASISQGGRLSVVTTEPNASVSPIHARMPLVLRFEEVDAWFGDGFAALADRMGFELRTHPEDGNDPIPQTDQLTLF